MRLGDVMNEVYKRQEELEQLLGYINFIQVGAGGVGTWFAISMALSVEYMTAVIVDDDVLEVHNLNRLPYPPTLVALNKRKPKKAEVLANFIKLLRPQHEVLPMTKRIENERDLEDIVIAFEERHPLNLLVDATDNTATSRIIRKVAKKFNVDLLSIHYDGLHITIDYCEPDEIRDDWETEEAQGYTIAPSVAFPPMFIGSLATALVLTERRNITISLNLGEVR